MRVCLWGGRLDGKRTDKKGSKLKPQLREESGERDRESFLPKGSLLIVLG